MRAMCGGAERAGAADDELTLQGRRVERVQRLTELEHHVVGDVDRGADRAHPGGEQPPLQPPRRHRVGVDTGDLPCCEPGGAGLRFEPNRVGLAVGRVRGDLRRIGELEVETAREFAGQAAHREAVAAVRGDLDLAQLALAGPPRKPPVLPKPGSSRAATGVQHESTP